jgi:hypothetical protein
MSPGERFPKLRLRHIPTLQQSEYIPWYKHEKTIAFITKLLKAENQGVKAYPREKILHALQLANAVHNALRGEGDISPKVQLPDSSNAFEAQLSRYAAFAEAASNGKVPEKYTRQVPNTISEAVRTEFYDALAQYRKKRTEGVAERREGRWSVESKIVVLGLIEYCSMSYPLASLFLTSRLGREYKSQSVYQVVKTWRKTSKDFIKPPYTKESPRRLEGSLFMKKNFASALYRMTGITVDELHKWLQKYSIENGDQKGFQDSRVDAAIFAVEKLAQEIR